MAERRKSRRTKSFLRGMVYVSRERGGLACLIRDLSQEGARIIFSDTVTLPNVFDLNIPQRNQSFRARVQWRRHDEMGVAFVDAAAERAGQGAADHGDAAAVAERVATLEAEITALRANLRKLKNKNPGDNEAA
jgi:hypothetical protein